MLVWGGTFSSFCGGEVETTWGVCDNPTDDQKSKPAIQNGVVNINRFAMETSGLKRKKTIAAFPECFAGKIRSMLLI
jgi:hypothetical protein